MKINLHIDKLHVGMFVETDVNTVTVDGQTRHYLELRDATFSAESGKRLRLTKKKQTQIAHAGGMLISSSKQINVLRDIDVLEVVVNTDKSDVVPDLPEVRREQKLTAKTPTFVDVETLLPPSGSEMPTPATDVADTKAPETIEAGITPRRKNFGPKSTGWMKVEISEERDKATLQVISFGGDPYLGASHVFSALRDLYGITNGLDDDLIERLAMQAAASPGRVIRGEFAVAVALLPETDETGHIEYPCFGDASSSDRQSASDLAAIMESDSLASTEDLPTRAHLALNGEELAEFVPPDGYQTPLDIFGKPLKNAGPSMLLKPGQNVALRGDKYLATALGYVSIKERQISVVSPIWVSPDRMAAHFVCFEQVAPGPALTADVVADALDAMQIRHGVMASAVEELAASPPSGDRSTAVLLARGSPAKASSSPRVETLFDPDWRKSQPTNTSSPTDARGGVVMVQADLLLAEVRASDDGEPGTDLMGRVIPPTVDGPGILRAGTNVFCEWQDDINRFYAAIEGIARLKGNSIRVKPVAHIKGDVDQNIVFSDADRDVYVTGSVRPGVTVKAAGTIAIDGIVESGAVVQSQEDVIVSKGIVGRQSQVVALGDVATKFVQNGSVVARGDVTVSGHVVNARIRAGGKFVAESDGTDRGGSVVGGQLIAASGVDVVSIGSTRSDPTCVGVGSDPQIAAQLQKVEKALAFCKTNIQRIFRTLGTSEIDVVALKNSIETSPPHKREPIVLLLNQLKGLAQTREKSLKTKSNLEAQQKRMLEGSEIKISGTVHNGVEVRFGEQSVATTDELSAVVFSREDSGIVCRQI